MHVEVVDILPPHSACIDDSPKSVSRAFLSSQPTRQKHDFAQHVSVFFPHISQRGDMLLRNHHEMHRSYRPNIMKGKNRVILVDLAAWNLAANDLAKNTVLFTQNQQPAIILNDPGAGTNQISLAAAGYAFPRYLTGPRDAPVRSAHRPG